MRVTCCCGGCCWCGGAIRAADSSASMKKGSSSRESWEGQALQLEQAPRPDADDACNAGNPTVALHGVYYTRGGLGSANEVYFASPWPVWPVRQIEQCAVLSLSGQRMCSDLSVRPAHLSGPRRFEFPLSACMVVVVVVRLGSRKSSRFNNALFPWLGCGTQAMRPATAARSGGVVVAAGPTLIITTLYSGKKNLMYKNKDSYKYSNKNTTRTMCFSGSQSSARQSHELASSSHPRHVRQIIPGCQSFLCLQRRARRL